MSKNFKALDRFSLNYYNNTCCLKTDSNYNKYINYEKGA